jgi:hypothetical protein
MKVFGIGLDKTGAITFGVCFKTLGMRHAPYDRRPVYRFAAGDLGPAFALADHYDSFEDLAWLLIFRELDYLYLILVPGHILLP